MFIPLHDANHLRHIRRQYVTFGLIALNVLVWFYTTFNTEEAARAAAFEARARCGDSGISR